MHYIFLFKIKKCLKNICLNFKNKIFKVKIKLEHNLIGLKIFISELKKISSISSLMWVFLISIQLYIWVLVLLAFMLPAYFYELEDYFYNFLCQCLEIVAFFIFCIKLFIVEIFKLLVNCLYFLNDYIKIDIDELVIKLETYEFLIVRKFDNFIECMIFVKLAKWRFIVVGFYGIMFWVYFLVICILYEFQIRTLYDFLCLIIIFIIWIIYLYFFLIIYV